MSGALKVTIAGAGALGLTTAVALADAGCAVTVCDPGGANASSVAAGMIAPAFEAVLDGVARPQLTLLLAARDLWPGLAQRAALRLDRSGALAVGDDAWLDRLRADALSLGLYLAEVGAATAQALAPGLSPAFARALLTREDWRVDPAATLERLRAAAGEMGVDFRTERVAARGDADVLVLATGALGGVDLAPELSFLSPIKGHILRFPTAASGLVVRGQGAYAVPGDGAMTIGATMEPGEADPAVVPAKAEPLKAAGAVLFPALANAKAEVAAGVRAATPDGLPLVGWSREPGVLLAVGARRNGWLLAPLAARLTAAYVTGRDAGPYAGQLDPARFEGRTSV